MEKLFHINGNFAVLEDDATGYWRTVYDPMGGYIVENTYDDLIDLGYKEQEIKKAERTSIDIQKIRENVEGTKKPKDFKMCVGGSCGTKDGSGFRKFDTGATRDTANGKLEYSNYIHPLNDYSFAKYMCSKQIIGGEYRTGDNRQLGIPYASLFESLCRHTEILKLIYKGYTVREYKVGDTIELFVSDDDEELEKKSEWLFENDIEYDWKNIESELNAIRFNSEAMKLQYITDNKAL